MVTSAPAAGKASGYGRPDAPRRSGDYCYAASEVYGRCLPCRDSLAGHLVEIHAVYSDTIAYLP